METNATNFLSRKHPPTKLWICFSGLDPDLVGGLYRRRGALLKGGKQKKLEFDVKVWKSLFRECHVFQSDEKTTFATQTKRNLTSIAAKETRSIDGPDSSCLIAKKMKISSHMCTLEMCFSKACMSFLHLQGSFKQTPDPAIFSEEKQVCRANIFLSLRWEVKFVQTLEGISFGMLNHPHLTGLLSGENSCGFWQFQHRALQPNCAGIFSASARRVRNPKHFKRVNYDIASTWESLNRSVTSLR